MTNTCIPTRHDNVEKLKEIIKLNVKSLSVNRSITNLITALRFKIIKSQPSVHYLR